MFRKILTSGFQQLQQRKPRSYQPWGCCLRPGSPSSPRKIRLSAALALGHKGYSRSKPIIFLIGNPIIQEMMVAQLYRPFIIVSTSLDSF